MKKLSLHMLLLLGLFLPVLNGAILSVNPTINFVSTDPLTQGNDYRVGSSNGGALLYLRGIGLPANTADSKVYIGEKTCEVEPIFTSILQIACRVPSSDVFGLQPITIYIKGQQAACNSLICKFKYDISRTPVLDSLIPRYINPNTDIHFGGICRATDSGSFKLKIGDFNCDLSPFGTQTVSSDSIDFVQCKIGQLPAGKYSVSLSVATRGVAVQPNVACNLEKAEVLTIFPQIDALSKNTGSTSGQVITITGKGFSPIPQENKVFYEGAVCEVTSSSYTSIQCNLFNPMVSASGLRPSHAGLKHRVFSSFDSLQALTLSLDFLQNGGEKYQLLSAETELNRAAGYAEAVEGFFKAPATGTYKFLISAGGAAQLHISSDPLSKDSLNLIAEVKGSVKVRDFYDPSENNQISQEIQLQEGQYYYLQAIHLGKDNKGHLSVGVIIPSQEKKGNSLKKIISVKVQADVVLQRGTLKLKKQDSLIQFGVRKLTTILKTVGFNFPGTNSEIEANFVSAGLPIRILSRNFVDGSGNVVDKSLAVEVHYSFEFLNTSSVTTSTKPFSFPSGAFELTLDNVPTTLLTGNFELGIGDQTLALNFDQSENDLISVLLNIPGIGLPKVTRYGNCRQGCEWRISFEGNCDDVPPFSLASQGTLAGGKSGSLSVQVNVIQESSNDLLFTSIPGNMLFTAEDNSQITVQTNGLLASCPKGNCNYQVEDIPSPIVTGFNLNGKELTVSLQDGENLAKEQFSVVFAKIQTSIVSYDASTQTLAAEIPLNNASNPMIVAGTHIPQVVIDGTDILYIDASVSGVIIQPTITDVSVDTHVISDGFLGLNITGTGFGYDINSNFDITVEVGQTPCYLIAVTNAWIYCKTSSIMNTGSIEVSVNGVSVNIGLNFANPDNSQTIDIPDNSDDATSGDGTLIVTGPDYDQSTNVIVKNDETGEVSTCKVCSLDGSMIECSAAGLAPGTYTVTTHTFLPPNSLTQQTSTITVPLEITSIEPKLGSQVGGTQLTITGNGFSNIYTDNQVSIGYLNLPCKVIEATRTTIKCITAPNTYYSEPQSVTVLYRLEYVAECKGDCKFTYSEDHTPVIEKISHADIIAGDSLAITGKGFTATTEIRISGVLAKIITVTETEIAIEVPEISAGLNLPITAYNPAAGNFKVPQGLIVNHALQTTDFSPKEGSKAGTNLIITGKGFSSNATVLIGTTTCKVLTVATDKITCLTAPNAKGLVIVKQDTFQKTISTVSFASKDALTPIINTVSSQTSATETTLTLDGQLLDLAGPVQVTIATPEISYTAEIITSSGTSIQARLTESSAGLYNITVKVGYLIAKFSTPNSDVIDIPLTVNPISKIQSSIAGGVQLQINGVGFSEDSDLVEVRIGGFICKLISTSFNQIVCEVPPHVNSDTQHTYLLSKEALLTGRYFTNESNADPASVFDNNTATYFNPSTTPNDCYFGVDFGDDLIAKLTQIQFYPKDGANFDNLAGSVFEASNNDVDYFTLATLGNNIYEGWNTITNPMADRSETGFRYLRFRKSMALSKCEIAEVRVKGILLSSIGSINTAIIQAPAKVQVNGKASVLQNVVEYRTDSTPVITSIDPKFGSTKGNTQLNLYGSGLSQATEVKIDNVVCDIISTTDSQITCTTRALPPIAQRRERVTGTINVFVNGNGKAVATDVTFLYADRWSDPETWGCSGFPREYDSVHVETGMNLLVDISPPTLVAVVVEGALIFADDDINFAAQYVLIRNGFLQIGTEEEPIQHKINITLTGIKASEQLPIFGTKVIGLYEGSVNIHGQSRTVSTTLLETAQKGETIIKISGSVDWAIGEKIVISSTTSDPSQNEEKTIRDITATTIELDSPLQFDHLVRETTEVDGQTFEINTEIILLSRNIIIQGDISSDDTSYGAHLLFYDPGTESTIVKISYTELTRAGQAGFLGRFPINFQQAGNQQNSYLKGNSIHHTYQRGIQLQATHYLSVENNAVYAAQGYGINLEDGNERFNIFEDNIVMGCRATLQYLSTQENAIAYRISNPTNIFRRNKAVANPSVGFWFDLKSYATGASASRKTCPVGERLGAFEDNTAAWNSNYGLRFDTYAPRTYPCKQTQYTDQIDLFANNPPVSALFKNNYFLGNGYEGLQASNVGAVEFDGIVAAENGYANVDITFTESGPINSTVISNAYLIGSTSPDTKNVNNRGIRLARSEGLRIKNVHFVNFTTTRPALEIDSRYWNEHYYDSGARTVFVSDFKFTNVDLKVRFFNESTHIIRDLDGSLTGIQDGGTVVNDLPHLRDIEGCTGNLAAFEGGLACDSTTEFRRIVFYETAPDTLIGTSLQVLRMLEDVKEEDRSSSDYTTLKYRYGRSPVKSYALPFALGQAYKLFYAKNADFTGLTVELSPHWNIDDVPATLMFNHTAPREGFDVSRWGRLNGNETSSKNSALWSIYDINAVDDKYLGDWYHNKEKSELYVAMVGGNHTKIKIVGYTCRTNCPGAPSNGEKITVLWSNVTIWPGNVLPKQGDDIIIPWNYSVILDINPPALGAVEIQGDLIFDSSQDRGENIFTAKRIWVRGNLQVGYEDAPFPYKATITLTGTRSDKHLLVSSAVEAGNKVLAVTGNLSLFGEQVTTRVRAVENIPIGSKSIKIEGELIGWKSGYKVAITSSFNSDSVYEVAEIDSITTDGYINLKTATQYFHYGAAAAYDGDGTISSVDYRTEVILLDRSIQIQGTKEDNWGARILITEQYYDTSIQTGFANIQYVAMENCGQPTSTAALSFEMMSNVTQGDSIVKGAVIIDSLGWGVKFQQAQSVIFEDNTIFTSRQFGIFFDTNNAHIQIIGNRVFNTILESDVTYAFLEGVSSGIYLADLSANIAILQDNIVAGFQIGYVLKASECDAVNPYSNNIAYSGEIGFLIITESNKCAEISGFIAYRTDFGILSYFYAKDVVAKNLILSDNKVSINLNSVGKDAENKLVTIKDSYFAAFALSDCPECYEIQGSCEGKIAIMLGVATQEGKQMPPRVQDRPWTNIWSSASFNSKQVFTNNYFVNFQDDILPFCKDNKVLKTNSDAADYTPVVTLSQSNLINVTKECLAYFNNPVAEERCGNQKCTGLNNVLIKDLDGTFIGKKGTIISKNDGVVKHDDTCEFLSSINGYICNQDINFAMLGFESLDSDKLTRVISPVKINGIGIDFTNTLNAFKAHDYFTNHLYTRLARFPSVIQANQAYSIEFSGTLPSTLQYQLEGGSSTDYSILKISYYDPQIVSVFNALTNEHIAPVPTEFSTPAAIKDNDPCGTNYYDSSAHTISFKITADPNCKLYIKKTNVLAVNIRYDMTPEEFFQQGGAARFIDKVASILKISHSRIRVVSLTKGSVIFYLEILADMHDPAQAAMAQAQLQSFSTALQQAYNAGGLNVYGNARILNFDHKAVLAYEVNGNAGTGSSSGGSNNEEKHEDKKSKLLMILTIACSLVAIALSLFLIYKYRQYSKNAKAVAKVAPEPPQSPIKTLGKRVSMVLGISPKNKVPPIHYYHPSEIVVEQGSPLVTPVHKEDGILFNSNSRKGSDENADSFRPLDEKNFPLAGEEFERKSSPFRQTRDKWLKKKPQGVDDQIFDVEKIDL